jgi:hypothetical protein
VTTKTKTTAKSTPAKVPSPLAAAAALVAGQPPPELMAIGDSLYNGVRSLSITPALAPLSAPAQAAKSLGFDFVVPDYPYEILIDVEDFLRGDLDFHSFTNLESMLFERIAANAASWLKRRNRWSDKTFFDNVSNSGATISSLYTDTARHHRGLALDLISKLLNDRVHFTIGDVGSLHYSLNTAFLLNPSVVNELDDLTPVDLVALRKPRRLLVNIGSNEGIFMGGLLARYDSATRQSIAAIPGKMVELANQMVARFGDYLPQTIVFNKLVRPSAIANLTPRPFSATPDAAGYFERYYGNLVNSSNIAGSLIKAFDEQIAGVNADAEAGLRKVFAGKGVKLAFADLYALSTKLDDKGGREKDADAIRVELHGKKDVHLTNFPLWSFAASGGGIFSLDNMHLSTVGYAAMADTVVRALAAAEGLKFTPVNYQAACDADTLLQQPPTSWFQLKFVVQLIGGLALAFDLLEA